jgi:hypothetical protein
VTPVIFLNALLKAAFELNPHSKAIPGKVKCSYRFEVIFPEFDTILRQVFDIQFVAILVFAIQIL